MPRITTQLKFNDRLAIFEKLKEICHKTDTDGTCIFTEGWDDDRVAKELSSTEQIITKDNVRGLRQEMFGSLFKRSAKGRGIAHRVQDHEERIQLIEAEVDRLTKLFNSRPISVAR